MGLGLVYPTQLSPLPSTVEGFSLFLLNPKGNWAIYGPTTTRLKGHKSYSIRLMKLPQRKSCDCFSQFFFFLFSAEAVK